MVSFVRLRGGIFGSLVLVGGLVGGWDLWMSFGAL